MTEDILALLPWLHLESEVSVNGITFRPVSIRGRCHPLLVPVEPRLRKLLEFFPTKGDRGAFVTTSEEWAVPEAEFPRIGRTTGRLYLASFAGQQYYSVENHYVNSAAFELFRTFPTDVISYQTRSRLGAHYHLGATSDMGTFAIPPQIYFCGVPNPELRFLDALCAEPEPDWIAEALDFFLLATRDEQALDQEREIMLMGAAYERLLGTNSAFKMATSVAGLLSKFSSGQTIADLRTKGRVVRQLSDVGKENRLAGAAPHEGWAYEFYGERNTVIHGNATKPPGAWDLWEHLLMAGHLFPLLVKLKLQALGVYALTSEDEVRLFAIDRLLAADSWRPSPNGEGSRWHRIHFEVDLDRTLGPG